MNLTEEQKQILLNDEENRIAFEAFLEQINLDYKVYFNNQEKRKTVLDFFSYVVNQKPPAIRLRYLEQRHLDEEIRLKVVDKYRELFGNDADYQVIED
ncbi:hypothetical protein FW778_17170 [Ginsengibacter hankyongi]|uniref:Uncharacterized protein n=1 Tax=Ginsengibacter hankyongi TaxID=2607284 RepID=A0A5J5ICV1_9BACT|nr:hypothetical protein [Ginsengibacter hankyongi]KAA9037160.1 hypothetical protein FW778_17170 [Ginsengibacter hankyongi]